MIQVAFAPCSPFSVTKGLMAESGGALAARYDCGPHTHLAETQDEDAFCLSLWLQALELLETWLDGLADMARAWHPFRRRGMARLGRLGVGVCHCPTSNVMLASGHCRTRELEAAGVGLALGVDGSASNDSSNLMRAVRAA